MSKNKNINGSGKRPLEYKVFIKPDIVEEKTKGGIILTTDIKEAEQLRKTEGVLVATGAKAFDSNSWVDAPKIGDRVAIPSYAGYVIEGKDGHTYRAVLDREILYVEENINQMRK